ncbi:MAG TPA: hypothetical protein VEI02_11935 [Planctomycetota bacterium]|nr:hypothetical protein [Planctomycetota bacterium]
MNRILACALCAAAVAPAQYAGGTIFQSLDAFQPTGLNSISVPGNPGGLTTGEVLVYTAGWTNGARSLATAESLGAVFGDRNGDGKPFDWVNIDAMHVTWTNPAVQPKPFDFRFSFEYNVVNGSGVVQVNAGDVFKISAQGAYVVTIPMSVFQAAVGYTQPLNVDGYAEMPDGSVIVSFKGAAGTGSIGNFTNVITAFGVPGTVPAFGSDVFVIRPPLGLMPAIKLYQASDFQTIVNAVFTNPPAVTEIRDFDLQPLSTAVNNPYDPQNLWNSGDRPQLVFHLYGDENVLCTQSTTNPAGNSHIWALVQGSTGVGKYSTNLAGVGSAAVYMDALAVSMHVLPTGAAVTMDCSPLTSITQPGGGGSANVPQYAPGATVTFTARNLVGGANQTAAFVLGVTTFGGVGWPTGGAGYANLILSPFDPILGLCLQPPYAGLLTTGLSNADGTASTSPFVIPTGLAPTTFYVQAVQLGSVFPLSAPQALRVQ